MEPIDAPGLEPLPVLSHAVRAGDTIYCSGQVPLDADGNLVESDIGAMTRQVVANLEQVLAAAGATVAASCAPTSTSSTWPTTPA